MHRRWNYSQAPRSLRNTQTQVACNSAAARCCRPCTLNVQGKCPSSQQQTLDMADQRLSTTGLVAGPLPLDQSFAHGNLNSTPSFAKGSQWHFQDHPIGYVAHKVEASDLRSPPAVVDDVPARSVGWPFFPTLIESKASFIKHPLA